MKKKITILYLLLFFLVFFLTQCNSDKSSINTGAKDSSIAYGEKNNEENEPDRSDLPASKYFTVSDIIKGEYVKDGKFLMKVEVLNNTNYKFKNFELSARISYKMENEGISCERSAQYDEISPRIIANWLPHTTKKFSLTINHHGQLGCLNINYDRTPENIVLVLAPFMKAISVDAEVEGAFARYDLLPQWKERQIKEGLR